MNYDQVKLRDGRCLAYKEFGVDRNSARFKVVVIHGLGSSRDALFPCSQELADELGLYMVGFDRAGYGHSDPFPQRSVKSEALDIQDLADQLQLGAKFHIIAISIGGYSAWSCLKYIPHRIAGAALVAPAINYWWPCLPPSLSHQAFSARSFLDKCGLRLAHYFPGLYTWWSSQRWLEPGISRLDKHPQGKKKNSFFLLRLIVLSISQHRSQAQRQGAQESTARDILVQFASWEFDPSQVEQPGEGIRVDIWQGDRDYLVPALLQRCIHERLPWTGYHELPEMGHLFFLLPGRGEEIIRTLLI
ncbi:hypothetical protein SELMODRAFT_173531 [Selaginella moellendorffii]|uniref:AB hydrolase-1 domain-containing protein n=1 Tax=Selaginella moellendorffii TaxID=88036 RepID=D8RRE8_SELML|nr:hypothetical protein SELMODRAFT_173531 [Selaginella moellendorffii]